MHMSLFKILIIIAICFLLIFIVLIFVRKNSGETPKEVTPIPSPTISFPTPFPTPSFPQTPEITISGVEVKNFYQNAEEYSKQGDVQFSSIPQYNLVYLSKFNEFLVSILSSPFEDTRVIAEKDFIEKLGITELEACKLTVTVTTPKSVNPEFAGKKYRLSFCE